MPCCIKKNKEVPTINRPLLPLKAQQFFFTGGMNSVTTYISLHMKFVGLTTSDIIIINLCRPFANVVAPAVLGFLTDKVGRYKFVTGIVICVGALLLSTLLLVPKYSSNTKSLTANYSQDEHHNQISVEKCGASDFCNHTLNYLNLHKCHISPEWRQDSLPPNCTSITEAGLFIKATIHQVHASTCVYQIHDLHINQSKEKREIEFNSTVAVDSFCENRCRVMNSEECVITIGDWQVTFVTFLVVRIAAQLFTSATFNAVETTTIGTLKKHGGKYGKNRIWHHLAQSIFPFLSGVLMDVVKGSTGTRTMWPAYLLMSVCLCIYVGLLFSVTLHQEKMKGSPKKNLKALTTDKRCAILFIQAFFFGLTPGFMAVFLPIYLLNLNSPMYVIGLTKTATAITSMCLMFFSDKLIGRFGHMNILCAGFFINALRLFCYSIIRDPLWAVGIEILKSFAQHLVWVAVAKWAQILSPKGLLSTTLGTIRAMAYGIGRTVGIAVGGVCLIQLGEIRTFQMFSGIYIMFGAFWFLLYHLVLKRLVFVDEPASTPEQEQDVLEVLKPSIPDVKIEEKCDTNFAPEKTCFVPTVPNEKI